MLIHFHSANYFSTSHLLFGNFKSHFSPQNNYAASTAAANWLHLWEMISLPCNSNMSLKVVELMIYWRAAAVFFSVVNHKRYSANSDVLNVHYNPLSSCYPERFCKNWPVQVSAAAPSKQNHQLILFGRKAYCPRSWTALLFWLRCHHKQLWSFRFLATT